MPRKVSLLLLGGCAAAVLGVLLAASLDERKLAFTLGVRSTGRIVEIPPGDVACQGPIAVPADFATVEFGLGTYVRPGPELGIEVRDVESRDVVGRGTLPAGYPDNQKHLVDLGEIPEGQTVSVCLRNEGARKVAVYAGKPDGSFTSEASVDGKPRRYDMDFIFYRDEATSMLNLVPTAFERAALWLPSAVRGWIIWLLGGLVVFVVPALLLWALQRASNTSTQSS